MTMLTLDAPVIGYSTDKPVLRNVRFEARRGEIIAVLGGNGAGKTALLHWIAGILPRARGQCVVADRCIESPRNAVAAGIGLVVQDPDDQLLGGTVQQDAELGPRNLGLSEADVDARARDALATVGLAGLAERSIETLSYGERKRASLAGVLAMRPRLLLLDEPGAGLDPVAELALCATLKNLAALGTTLLVTTHAVDTVPRFASRVLVLGEGRVLADGPCREVLLREELLAAARVRRPWPVELWARSEDLQARSPEVTLTLEEVLECLTFASS